MIYYTSAEANYWRVFTIWYGSGIPRCLPQAACSGLLGLMFEYFGLGGTDGSLIQHPYVLTMLSMVLGYILAQRSNLAYQRWWEARTSLATLSARWGEAAMQTVEYDMDSQSPDARYFRARIVHLYSLLFALSLAELRGDWKFVDRADDLDTIRPDDPFNIASTHSDPVPASDSPTARQAVVALLVRAQNETQRNGNAAAPAEGNRRETGDSQSRLSTLPASETDKPLHRGVSGIRISWHDTLASARGHNDLRARTGAHAPARSNAFQLRQRDSGLSPLHFALTGMLHRHDPSAFRALALGRKFGVIGGVSEAERRCLAGSHARDRAYLVRTWLMRIMLARSKAGGLNQPPPVVTRAYQLLSEGVIGYQQARKVGDTPFPFPYVQLITLLLHAFNVLAPLTISALIVTPLDILDEASSGEAHVQGARERLVVNSSSNLLIFCLAFLVSLGYSGLNQVSRELEEPFGYGPNHLPLIPLNEEFNSKLIHLLLADAGQNVPDDPFIGPDAEDLSEGEKQERRVRFGLLPELMAALDQTKEVHTQHQVSDMIHPIHPTPPFLDRGPSDASVLISPTPGIISPTRGVSSGTLIRRPASGLAAAIDDDGEGGGGTSLASPRSGSRPGPSSIPPSASHDPEKAAYAWPS
mmetsp:Transcript_44332/g.102456  ORF Transcript_44332/g.102456 Transcript_44332/m.102456 type:complete len:642 (+) Transcript_44332:345-2270(+)